MQNPFKQNQDYSLSPKRNTFDLSFANNLTFNFGELIPCMCQELLPGDSMLIDPYAALRFMPTVFPVQTKCRGYIHFFYQRTKNIWKNWNEFQSANKESRLPGESVIPLRQIQMPYINQTKNDSRFGTGSISDYLGVPSVSHAKMGPVNVSYFRHDDTKTSNLQPIFPVLQGGSLKLININVGETDYIENATFGDLSAAFYGYIAKKDFKFDDLGSKPAYITSDRDSGFPYMAHAIGTQDITSPGRFYLKLFDLKSKFPLDQIGGALEVPAFAVIFSGDSYETAKAEKVYNLDFSISYDENNDVVYNLTTELSFDKSAALRYIAFYLPFNTPSADHPNVSLLEIQSETDDNPKFNVTEGMPISALPYRVYESIYNSFYRDSRNNPYFLNGIAEYNKFCDDSDGLDTNNYHIYRRNWELDRFTSCVQSPQQGIAPLVGISSLGAVTFQAEEDGKNYTFSTETASDADTITKVNIQENVPNSVARAALNLATSGISINDFRNVNAYQRWKETNIRRGFKIKDQIKSRWGVDVKENLLDMPEFLGGISFDVNINTVNNSSPTDSAPLGAYAGQMTAFGNSNNKIKCYADQHGFLMAIVSVVPTPCYGQIIPKHFFKFNPLDFYNPEFGQIGMQSVPYKELVPLETDKQDLEKTFGYQRPWYDYISNVDEVHGLFRTSLKDFILTREFVGTPMLNEEFLTINHNTLNNIFTIDSGHKILGQIKFNITAKRPIPSISVPSLE